MRKSDLLQILNVALNEELVSKNITPKEVIFNNPATVVFWSDGSKTVVKCGEGDLFNRMTGFLIAYYQKTTESSKSEFSKLYDKLNTEEVKIKL